MTKKLLYLLFLAFSISLVSCEKETEVPNIPVGGELTGDISEDMTFKTGISYIFDGTIRVRNAKLTFEAGSIIRFTEGSSLEFAYWDNEYATMEVLGTAALPVLFTSAASNPSGGDWAGLHFYKGATDCNINFGIIEYAGSKDTYGSVYIKETAIAFTNSIIREAANVGIRLKSEGAFSAFDKNFFTNIDSYPISVYINNVHTITGSNIYETSTGIWIENDEDFTAQGEYFWTDQGVPFYQEGTIRFGAEGEGSIVHIAPGTEVLFMEGGLWDIAYWENQYATIIAEGTVEKPILFSSASNSPAAGDWKGFSFYEGAYNCSFKYSTFEFGGSRDYNGMIFIKESHVAFKNCEFYYSKTNAINLIHDAYFTDFGGNIFLGNLLYPISIFPNFVHTIIGENNIDTDLGIQIANDEELDIAGDYTWTKQSAPYIVEGTMRIGAPGNGIKLTIEPGVRIEFPINGQIDIAYWQDNIASVIANGSIDDPIIFTSNKPMPNKGDWDGIYYYEGAYSCSISHSVISYAGGDEIPWGAINFKHASTPLNLSNTHFAHISAHGVSVDEESSVDISNNVTFEDLDGVEYHVR
ncbi:hypothetical protein [Lentimicrobium sp. S6]|uniref:hypothetical protein n=1 Tax=Lentimicrobium sp. S6 TaxID=2735872 RepID=UPI0015579D31|nr:hypothetical protein [Lentimicrobium sp. S6]NPD47998.1 hypothetical protein [Lentimicrobium sp. S6]